MGTTTKEFLTLSEAAAFAAVSEQTIRRYCDAGKLQRYYRGHRILVRADELAALVAVRPVPAIAAGT